MIPERSHSSNSIAGSGFPSTTPPHQSLRSISFDHSYLPSPSIPSKDSQYQRPSHVGQLYPIVSTWSLDSDDALDYSGANPRRRYFEEMDDITVASPCSLTPLKEEKGSLFERVKDTTKHVGKKLVKVPNPRKRSRETSVMIGDDESVYDSQPSGWTWVSSLFWGGWIDDWLIVLVIGHLHRRRLVHLIQVDPTRNGKLFDFEYRSISIGNDKPWREGYPSVLLTINSSTSTIHPSTHSHSYPHPPYEANIQSINDLRPRHIIVDHEDSIKHYWLTMYQQFFCFRFYLN